MHMSVQELQVKDLSATDQNIHIFAPLDKSTELQSNQYDDFPTSKYTFITHSIGKEASLFQ